MSHYTGAVPATEPVSDWRRLGSCRTHGEPDMWFPVGNSQDARAATREAQAICHTCPVRLKCGKTALERRDPWGVWGGMTEQQRRAILRRRANRSAQPSTTKAVA